MKAGPGLDSGAKRVGRKTNRRVDFTPDYLSETYPPGLFSLRCSQAVSLTCAARSQPVLGVEHRGTLGTLSSVARRPRS